jgi:hypothetical protein
MSSGKKQGAGTEDYSLDKLYFHLFLALWESPEERKKWGCQAGEARLTPPYILFHPGDFE